MKKYSTIIIGSGASALQLANHLHRDKTVLLITKEELECSNSYKAQGGIAVALHETDSPLLHYEDTIEAGRALHNRERVHQMTNSAPKLMRSLIRDGMSFDKDEHGQIALGMEGAHQRHRIIHSGGDATGKHVVQFLASQLTDNITILEHHFVFELVLNDTDGRCVGVKTKNRKEQIDTFFADHVVLASGGIGQLYAYTSNDSTVTGDGIALALAAGAEVVDMEFIQFHPTLLFANGKSNGLISEAVRGAGGVLVDEQMQPIMHGRHPLGDLAPRHIVAKAIYEERKKGREVYIHTATIQNFEQQFPTITAICQRANIPLNNKLIPVAPGCHFLMGGIEVNDVGATSIKGLYAIGEVARTGVHGANRLASNSLLECIHYGQLLAIHLNNSVVTHETINETSLSVYEQERPALCTKQELQQKMMHYVGIVRQENGLQIMLEWLQSFNIQHLDLAMLSREEIERVFMIRVALVITKSALARKESRGAHFLESFPNEQSQWQGIHIYQSHKGLEKRSNHYEQIKITNNA